MAWAGPCWSWSRTSRRAEARTFVLFTGAGSVDNLRMYKKAGFRLRPDREAPPGAVVLTKRAGQRISR